MNPNSIGINNIILFQYENQIFVHNIHFDHHPDEHLKYVN